MRLLYSLFTWHQTSLFFIQLSFILYLFGIRLLYFFLFDIRLFYSFFIWHQTTLFFIYLTSDYFILYIFGIRQLYSLFILYPATLFFIYWHLTALIYLLDIRLIYSLFTCHPMLYSLFTWHLMVYSLFIWHLTASLFTWCFMFYLLGIQQLYSSLTYCISWHMNVICLFYHKTHTLEIAIKVLITKVPSRKVVHFSSAIKFLLRKMNHIHESFQICLNFTTSSCMIEFYLELLINIVHRLIWSDSLTWDSSFVSWISLNVLHILLSFSYSLILNLLIK